MMERIERKKNKQNKSNLVPTRRIKTWEHKLKYREVVEGS